MGATRAAPQAREQNAARRHTGVGKLAPDADVSLYKQGVVPGMGEPARVCKWATRSQCSARKGGLVMIRDNTTEALPGSAPYHSPQWRRAVISGGGCGRRLSSQSDQECAMITLVERRLEEASNSTHPELFVPPKRNMSCPGAPGWSSADEGQRRVTRRLALADVAYRWLQCTSECGCRALAGQLAGQSRELSLAPEKRQASDPTNKCLARDLGYDG